MNEASATAAVPAGGLDPSVPLALDASHITVDFPAGRGRWKRVIDDVGLGLERSQVTVLLGESGSGKSVFARSITGLAPASARIGGSAVFDGVDLVTAGPRALRAIHGARVGMVPQDPNSSLDPMRRIGSQIAETLLRHRRVSGRDEARVRAAEALADVRIHEPERVLSCYPHEVSGGMRQRIAIAIALSCEPELIVADEPSSALDASVGAHVVGLLDDLRVEHRTAVLFITHDIGIAARIASLPQDRVVVMLGGRVVELGHAADVLGDPRHRYTRALIAAEPSASVARGELAIVPDEVRMRRDWGPLREVAPGHAVADGEEAA